MLKEGGFSFGGWISRGFNIVTVILILFVDE